MVRPRQYRMAGLRPDQEEDVSKRSGPYFSHNFMGNFQFPGNAIRERRPLVGRAYAKGSLEHKKQCSMKYLIKYSF